MSYYRKAGYENFLAEMQGARIRRMLLSKNSEWKAQHISELIGKKLRQTMYKLSDESMWGKEEVRKVAEASGIPFDELWVPHNNDLLQRSRSRASTANIRAITGDLKRLNDFTGVQLDTRTRDVVMRYLLKLESYIADNKVKIRKRRNKERTRRKKIIVYKLVVKQLHRETGISEPQLHHIKAVHRNYLQFQDRFDELWKFYWKNPRRAA